MVHVAQASQVRREVMRDRETDAARDRRVLPTQYRLKESETFQSELRAEIGPRAADRDQQKVLVSSRTHNFVISSGMS